MFAYSACGGVFSECSKPVYFDPQVFGRGTALMERFIRNFNMEKIANRLKIVLRLPVSATFSCLEAYSCPLENVSRESLFRPFMIVMLSLASLIFLFF